MPNTIPMPKAHVLDAVDQEQITQVRKAQAPWVSPSAAAHYARPVAHISEPRMAGPRRRITVDRAREIALELGVPASELGSGLHPKISKRAREALWKAGYEVAPAARKAA